MSQSYSYVQIIALDFSKAFDTVRNYTLMEKIAALPLPDIMYNWIVNYLAERPHCTKSKGVISPAQSINASVVQGSALGPVSFIINATDLNVVTNGNRLHKYADDTYLNVPSSNNHSISAELAHIAEWAESNNLKLNTSKPIEMVVRSKRSRKNLGPPTPAPIPDIVRVEALNVLCITTQSNQSVSQHVSDLISSSGQNLYALKVLKAHGLSLNALSDICHATKGL
jgi:hypothetical protein